jgi:hypothetical protein
MATFTDKAKALAATAAEIAELQGATLEARVLREAFASLIQSGYDNWDGGTDFYTFALEVPIPTYAALENERDQLEETIHNRISQLVRTDSGSRVSNVVISPMFREDSGSGLGPKSLDALADDEAPAFWQPGYFRAFISHVSARPFS